MPANQGAERGLVAPAEELAAIGEWLGSVHVKDRVRGGFTVPLGEGDADFQTCFAEFHRLGFSRWFILQAARQMWSRLGASM